ncbi:hypothetical protein O2313_07490 [Bacillus amyloliquefaciens]|uniref:hypothetical protein n=1 Tax=Bacillus amyloliquefaciens TaxID=1390 RepID=UPI0022AF3403|nr:hypothetical protein [Bacillus amyloliquefaciens]MCZ4247359.1 hypothetical protein [Bacillus amyloliquefaciens]
MGEPSDEIEAGGRSAPLGKTRTDPRRTYHLPISAISMIILPSYVHELYEGGIREVLEKRRNFLGYSRIQLIIAQFVLGKVCICKIHV